MSEQTQEKQQELRTNIMDSGHGSYAISNVKKTGFYCEFNYYPYVEWSNLREHRFWLRVTKAGNSIIEKEWINHDNCNIHRMGKRQVSKGFVEKSLAKISEIEKMEDSDDQDLAIKTLVESVKSEFEGENY